MGRYSVGATEGDGLYAKEMRCRAPEISDDGRKKKLKKKMGVRGGKNGD